MVRTSILLIVSLSGPSWYDSDQFKNTDLTDLLITVLEWHRQVDPWTWSFFLFQFRLHSPRPLHSVLHSTSSFHRFSPTPPPFLNPSLVLFPPHSNSVVLFVHLWSSQDFLLIIILSWHLLPLCFIMTDKVRVRGYIQKGYKWVSCGERQRVKSGGESLVQFFVYYSG